MLSAPPLAASVPAWQRALAPVLGRVAPNMVLANPIAGEQLSRDPAVGVAYFADPLVQPRSTARLGAAAHVGHEAGGQASSTGSRCRRS